jgi:hypothetical protein
VTPALLLLVFVLLAGALAAGTTIARQARRLPVLRTPPVSDGSAPTTDRLVPRRQRPHKPPKEHTEASEEADEDLTEPDEEPLESGERPLEADENDPTYLAVMAALQAHSHRADRKAFISNLLFFTAGVLASILTTLLIHPL